MRGQSRCHAQHSAQVRKKKQARSAEHAGQLAASRSGTAHLAPHAKATSTTPTARRPSCTCSGVQSVTSRQFTSAPSSTSAATVSRNPHPAGTPGQTRPPQHATWAAGVWAPRCSRRSTAWLPTTTNTHAVLTGSQVQRRVERIVAAVHRAACRHQRREHVRLPKRGAVVQRRAAVLGAAGGRNLGAAQQAVDDVGAAAAGRNVERRLQRALRQQGRHVSAQLHKHADGLYAGGALQQVPEAQSKGKLGEGPRGDWQGQGGAARHSFAAPPCRRASRQHQPVSQATSKNLFRMPHCRTPHLEQGQLQRGVRLVAERVHGCPQRH